MQPRMKACRKCGLLRPDTAIDFPLYAKKQDVCLSCVTASRRRRRALKAEARDRKIAARETRAVDTMLSAVRVGGATVPHSAELLENVMEYFGGVGGFSAVMMKQYFDAKPGSATRSKMLEMMTRLVTTNAEQGGSKKPLTFWSEEELNAEIDQRLEEAAVAAFPRHVTPRVLTVETPAETTDDDQVRPRPAG